MSRVHARAKAVRSRPVTRRRRAASGRGAAQWSQRVTRTSHALDLDDKVFAQRSAKAVAASLKRSALKSKQRKASPYQSAMSMLSFYINRAGRTLSVSQARVLERAKSELRRAFGREPAPRGTRKRRAPHA